jgi:hypothetical protein
MLRIFAVCVGAALVWAGSALGAPQLVQNENGDAALLFDILAQRRPALATSSTPGGAFGPLTTLTPTPTAIPYGLLEHQNVAIDDHGGAVAAWSRADPSGVPYEAYEAYVSVKPPGGEFGPPQRLSEADRPARETQVDVNPRGDAIVAWLDSGSNHSTDAVMYSIRPTGGTFSVPAIIPGAITDHLTVVLEADGGALFIGNGPSSGNLLRAYSVYRRPDGTFEQPVALDPASGLAAIAANRRGDVLIAWGEKGKVLARERPAGGSFGAPEIVATGDDILGGDVQAALNDSGDAAITFDPSWLVMRTHGGAFGPRQPRPPVPDAFPTTERLAMNERGDVAIAWVEPIRRVMAVYRPAGGALSPPMLLGVAPFFIHGGREPPLWPALSLDGAGTGTVVWEDTDGETIGIRARRFDAAGPGSPETVTTLPAYVQEAPPEACVPPGFSVLARSGRAVVVQGNSPPFLAGCLLARGVLLPPQSPGSFTYAQLPLRVAVAGPFSAIVLRASGHGYSVTDISISDLRDEWSGQSRDWPALSPVGIATVPVLRLKRDGSAAWIACPPGKKRARGACRQGSKRIKQVYAFGLSRDTPILVGQGSKIDPASLRIGTDRVWWRDGGHRRSAPLG